MRCLAPLLLVGCSGSEPRALSVHWDQPIGAVSPALLGHNAVWSRGGLGIWDDATHAVRPDVDALVTALHPGIVRFPGGSRAMLYHFDETIGPYAGRKPQCDTFTGQLDPTTWGMDEALQYAEQRRAAVTLVTPWGDGTPERAAAMVAYANATSASTITIGVDANGHDWGTAADWAARRATNGHPAPYAVPFVEIGNEQYLSLRPGTNVCGTDHAFTQAERLENGVYIPSTVRDVAQQIAKTSRLIKQIDPSIRVGAPALTDVLGIQKDPATAISDVDANLATGDAWNPTLLALAGADFDFFVLHIYDFSTTPDRVRLADNLATSIDALRSLGATQAFAVTEFGTLFDGDTQLNALISADFVRVAAERGVLANLRHILIEDQPSGLFATSAAILGDTHLQTPGYHAMAALADALQPIAVAASSPDPQLTVLATRDDATDTLGIAVIDRRLAQTVIDLALPLPAGHWHGTQTIESADSLTSSDVQLEQTPIEVTGTVHLVLPPNGLAVLRLTTIP
ncbi:MAG: hypothetical protein JO257_22990 [Deltaproteobacteria bacterium]|nr:hypothetical protein [Deltaproteobacteria bacterium]